MSATWLCVRYTDSAATKPPNVTFTPATDGRGLAGATPVSYEVSVWLYSTVVCRGPCTGALFSTFSTFSASLLVFLISCRRAFQLPLEHFRSSLQPLELVVVDLRLRAATGVHSSNPATAAQGKFSLAIMGPHQDRIICASRATRPGVASRCSNNSQQSSLRAPISIDCRTMNRASQRRPRLMLVDLRSRIPAAACRA
jgi:hypothetical protein